MKLTRIISLIFALLLGALGVFLGIWSVELSLRSVDAEPVLLVQPEAAREQVETMLELVCAGDFDGAGALMQGTPAMGADRPAGDAAEDLIWQALLGSMSYELVGQCYPTDSGIAQDIRFTCLDLNSVTATLKARSQALLQQRIDAAEDVSEVYDENNNYREDVVMEALLEATREALAQDAEYTTVQITVNLVYDQDRWQIIPDDTLLQTISGGILN